MNKTDESIDLTTLGGRIQWILHQEQLKQVDFAKQLGISANYVYLLTSGRKNTLSETLARLIESTFGYAAQWILFGGPQQQAPRPMDELQRDMISRVKQMGEAELRAVAAFIRTMEEIRA